MKNTVKRIYVCTDQDADIRVKVCGNVLDLKRVASTDKKLLNDSDQTPHTRYLYVWEGDVDVEFRDSANGPLLSFKVDSDGRTYSCLMVVPHDSGYNHVKSYFDEVVDYPKERRMSNRFFTKGMFMSEMDVHLGSSVAQPPSFDDYKVMFFGKEPL